MRRSVAVILICVMALLAACSTANTDSADTSATISDKTYVKSTAPAETQAVKKSFEEYVVLKEEIKGEQGTFSQPELKLYSGITKSVNDEISAFTDSGLKNSAWVYDQYYTGELNDRYLTFYVVQRCVGSVRNFLIFTIDLETDKVLDNNDIIDLLVDDRDAFYSAFIDVLKKQEDTVFTSGSTDLEKRIEKLDLPVNGEKPSEKEYIFVEEENTSDKIKLGYLGGNKLLGVAVFKPAAGPEGADHIFEFTYGK